MTPEKYHELYYCYAIILRKSPIVAATTSSTLLISAKNMNITDIFDNDAFNKAMYNDVLLNRTCLTPNGEYEDLPAYLVYLYLCDISVLCDILLDIYEKEYGETQYLPTCLIAALNILSEKKYTSKFCTLTYIEYCCNDIISTIKITYDEIFINKTQFKLNTEQLIRTLKLNEITKLV